MPREKHLETLHRLVDAAYDAGTLTHSFENKGGKEQVLRVSFTLTDKQRPRQTAGLRQAFGKIFTQADVPI